jgi:Fic-DOC domain mobile mystery protein B
MFQDTWRWAGKFRNSAKNIGVDTLEISSELKKLFDDVAYQILHNSYVLDEIAYRLHHRLVLIHPFPNGNGRHSRLMSDILLLQAGRTRFTWGAHKLEAEGPTRKQYISALKDADKHDYTGLANFVRS